jgi:hypothetical protein
MSFLHDALRPGTSQFHKDSGDQVASTKQQRQRNSKSYGGLLSPLTSLIRDPAGSIGEILGSLSQWESQSAQSGDSGAESRLQVLQLRMKEVWVHYCPNEDNEMSSY